MAHNNADAQIAVFLDVENLAIHAQQQGIAFSVGPIVDRARMEGRVIVARAYGDFAKPFMYRVLLDLQRSVFELGQLPTDIKGKNTADMLLALDALEMCLQPSAPNVIIIGSGDRDYVPLVQRLRRYGAWVIGVGLKGSISVMLRTVCDDYWYYEDLQGAIAEGMARLETPHIQEVTHEAPLDRAVRAFVSIVKEIEATGESCPASRVCEIMRQRDPSLRLQDIGFSAFKDFAAEVERRGLVRLSQRGMSLYVSAEELASEMPAPSAEESITALCNQYRAVLEKKRVPLVPWEDRRKLIEALWNRFAEALEGMTIREMSETMELAAAELGLNVPQQAIYKMTYTLNLGRCFMVDQTPFFVEDIFGQRVMPACDVHDALDRMHVTYLRGIMLDRPDLPLRPEAVAKLLFDEPTDTQIVLSRDYIRKAEAWRDY